MFLDIIKSVETVLSSGLTVGGTTVKIYPANYSGKISGNEWVRVNVLPINSNPNYNADQTIEFLINFNIFVPAGKGPRRAHEIADAIDGMFIGKTLDGNIQVTNSYITTLGVDPINKGLYRIDWNGASRKY